MDFGDLGRQFANFLNWLGINPTPQDAFKAILLISFALATLMILGDIYRGEIQNTLHRVRLVKNTQKTRDANYKSTFLLPNRMVGHTLDGVFTNVLIYYRYHDHRGRLRTRFLTRERVKLKVRSTLPTAWAGGHEKDHSYTDEEKSGLAKEKPDLEVAGLPNSEIVAMAQSRVDLIDEQWKSRMNRADDAWSKLSRSRIRRFFARIKEEELREPQKVGLVVKFHFPIDPYFLLYRHPESNVRSTAWLTVLTSLFAIFMQIVYSQPRAPDARSQTAQSHYEEPSPASQRAVATILPKH